VCISASIYLTGMSTCTVSLSPHDFLFAVTIPFLFVCLERSADERNGRQQRIGIIKCHLKMSVVVKRTGKKSTATKEAEFSARCGIHCILALLRLVELSQLLAHRTGFVHRWLPVLHFATQLLHPLQQDLLLRE
jgi:hypothetical protein